MSGFNPTIENRVIWGFTQEEIQDRWTLWQKYDTLNRLFADNKESASTLAKFRETTIPKPNVSGRALDKLLDNL